MRQGYALDESREPLGRRPVTSAYARVMRVHVCTTIAATPEVVWAEVERLERHVEWMTDAEHIRFVDEQQSGVGTRFECTTRVWKLKLEDLMVVTEWEPERSLGVAHRGLVTGLGRFTLKPRRHGQTRFCWDERLSFPWWMGGPLAGIVAWPILRSIWGRNLVALKHIVESGRPLEPTPAPT